jgi:hypothetical protein
VQVEGLASNALGGLSKLQNLSITLQRRWSNVLSDAQRQHIVELFLGLRLPTYLPSAQPLYSATLPLEVIQLVRAVAIVDTLSDLRELLQSAGLPNLGECAMLQAESDEEAASPAATAAEQQRDSIPAVRQPTPALPPQLVNMQTSAQPQRLGRDAEATAAQHSTTERPPPQVNGAPCDGAPSLYLDKCRWTTWS